jgi:hypothetical protein
VILHHVPHRARLVVIGPAPADADLLGHGDLHVIHVLRVPERFEQDVAEPYGHQVLDRLLPEIMVDPVDLRLVEIARQRTVQRPGGGEIVAEGLFHDDPCVLPRDLELVQPFRQVTEQARRHREIEGLHRVRAHLVAQIGPAAIAARIHREVIEPLEELRHMLRRAQLGGNEFLQRRADPVGPVLRRLLRARRADDPRLARHLPVAEPPEQRRQDLAPRQIARAAENHEVEGIDRYDTRNHVPVSASGC